MKPCFANHFKSTFWQLDADLEIYFWRKTILRKGNNSGGPNFSLVKLRKDQESWPNLLGRCGFSGSTTIRPIESLLFFMAVRSRINFLTPFCPLPSFYSLPSSILATTMASCAWMSTVKKLSALEWASLEWKNYFPQKAVTESSNISTEWVIDLCRFL